MFPNWHNNIRIPTVGDDVHIGPHTITVQANDPNTNISSFSISVQPRSGAQQLSERGKAIAALIQHTHNKTLSFLDIYATASQDQQQIESFQIEIKNLLENFRSTLEYTAHFLAEYCDPKPAPDKIQFPIANRDDTKVSFEKKLERWFPGLSNKLPEAKNFLLSIQKFNGDSWLHDLAELTNYVKHRLFLGLASSSYSSLTIGYGNAQVRLGELGIRSLCIENGGKLRFERAPGDSIDILGPCELYSDRPLPAFLDPRLVCLHEQVQLVGVEGVLGSLPGAIWRINKNVYRTVDSLCSIASNAG